MRKRGQRAESESRVARSHALGLLEVLPRVGVLHVARRHVQLELGSKVLDVVVEGHVLLRHVLAACYARLVGPSASDVADRVAAAADDHEGDVEGAHEGDAVGVACFGGKGDGRRER